MSETKQTTEPNHIRNINNNIKPYNQVQALLIQALLIQAIPTRLRHRQGVEPKSTSITKALMKPQI